MDLLASYRPTSGDDDTPMDLLASYRPTLGDDDAPMDLLASYRPTSGDDDAPMDLLASYRPTSGDDDAPMDLLASLIPYWESLKGTGAVCLPYKEVAFLYSAEKNPLSSQKVCFQYMEYSPISEVNLHLFEVDREISSLVPRPRPAFRRLQYGPLNCTASDGKLGRTWERG